MTRVDSNLSTSIFGNSAMTQTVATATEEGNQSKNYVTAERDRCLTANDSKTLFSSTSKKKVTRVSRKLFKYTPLTNGLPQADSKFKTCEMRTQAPGA